MDQAQAALGVLIHEGKLAASEVMKALQRRDRLVQALRASLAALEHGVGRLGRQFKDSPFSMVSRRALADCKGRSLVGEKVFLTEGGQPYSVSTINRYFRKAKELAGITRRFRFHDLRHSFASLLASRGVSIQVIAKALGHSSSTMAERYARPNEEAMKSILSALNSASTRVPARAEKPDRHRKKSNSFSNSAADTSGEERL